MPTYLVAEFPITANPVKLQEFFLPHELGSSTPDHLMVVYISQFIMYGASGKLSVNNHFFIN